MTELCKKCRKRPRHASRKYPELAEYCEIDINNARRDLRVAGVPKAERTGARLLEHLERTAAHRPDGPGPVVVDVDAELQQLLGECRDLKASLARVELRLGQLVEQRREAALEQRGYTLDRMPAGGGQRRTIATSPPDGTRRAL